MNSKRFVSATLHGVAWIVFVCLGLFIPPMIAFTATVASILGAAAIAIGLAWKGAVIMNKKDEKALAWVTSRIAISGLFLMVGTAIPAHPLGALCGAAFCIYLWATT